MKCQPIPIETWNQYKSGPFTIIVAQTPCERQQGLQGTKQLGTNTLVLFLDIKGGTYFHTQNCFFAIDIIALDNANKILKFWTAKPNLSSTGPVPSGTARVLEANAGWLLTNDLKVGDIIPFIKV